MICFLGKSKQKGEQNFHGLWDKFEGFHPAQIVMEAIPCRNPGPELPMILAKPDEKPRAGVTVQGTVGYVQLCGSDSVLTYGFVIGVSVLLLSGESLWVRDFYRINWIQSNVGGEEDGAACTESKALSMVWEMKVARRRASVDLQSLGASTG